MIRLEDHPCFTKYTDPKSGVESYLLTEKVAGMYQHFYFSESSVTKDGRYLWIICTNPPSWFKTLAVVSLDPDDPFIRHFPQAGISGGCPCITPEQDGVYFPNDDSIYKVDLSGNVTRIFQLDPDFLHYRPVCNLSTHCTVSCDGKYMILDMMAGGSYYVVRVELATGQWKVLNNFGRCYDHAQFCPTRPDLFLIDQDWWRDYHSGEYFCIDNRIWLMNTEGTMFEPLIPGAFYGRDGSEICHDFWSEDGRLCWIDYRLGAFECDIDTRAVRHVWKRPVCHSHTSPDRSLWVGDQTPYLWSERDCEVLFYDRQTNKEIAVFSALPEPPVRRGNYHMDPHPQFVCGGQYIVATATVGVETATVSITPVDKLLEKCRAERRIVLA
ncbi:MAG: hypothetical protein IKM31_02360 [Oscillospiraceae bacterium]|nr:hypothetical protein [Oscillospiraceae bacterium]